MVNRSQDSQHVNGFERVLHAASLISKANNDSTSEQILVNSVFKIEVLEELFAFDGPIQPYAIDLYIPSDLYFQIAGSLDATRSKIKDALNQAFHREDAFIESVRITINEARSSDWRESSGSLTNGEYEYSIAEAEESWGEGLRVFISHHSSSKEDATELGGILEDRAMSTFVAHLDIQPLSRWEKEMENRLRTMDVLVAMLTEQFKNSDWCSQEVGYAVARGIPIVPVRMGIDPYGFIGKYQAVTDGINGVSEYIENELSDHSRMAESRNIWITNYIRRIRRSGSFARSNLLAEELPKIVSLTINQADEIAEAINSNEQAIWAWGFNRKRKQNDESNIAEHLTRVTGQRYVLNDDDDSSNEWLVRRETGEDLADLVW